MSKTMLLVHVSKKGKMIMNPDNDHTIRTPCNMLVKPENKDALILYFTMKEIREGSYTIEEVEVEDDDYTYERRQSLDRAPSDSLNLNLKIGGR